MWVASQLGFYSIVNKDGAFHVRARVRKDLETLKRRANVKAKIERWPAADYRFRMRLNDRELSAIFMALEESVDYSNFKNRIAELPEQRDKLPAYHGLWADLMRLQEQADVDSPQQRHAHAGA